MDRTALDGRWVRWGARLVRAAAWMDELKSAQKPCEGKHIKKKERRFERKGCGKLWGVRGVRAGSEQVSFPRQGRGGSSKQDDALGQHDMQECQKLDMTGKWFFHLSYRIATLGLNRKKRPNWILNVELHDKTLDICSYT
ncbi:unnamed protein product, partial [Pleuronectes platessa]